MVLYSVVAGLSVGAALGLVTLYAEYGYHPVRDAAAWASQPIRYAVAGECAGCHSAQAAAIEQRSHARIACQTCHGALADHARTGTVELAVLSGAPAIERAACLACHERVSGRPTTFPAVTPASHFGGGTCALCHDSHTTSALAPPRVLHDLGRLPDCLICHGPDGLRPMSARHPDLPAGDCLVCHLRPGVSTP